MEMDCCKILRIFGLFFLLMILGVILFFGACGCKKCDGIKGKANKVFNDMGELIGEFNFKK